MGNDTPLKRAATPRDVSLPMSRLYIEDVERLVDLFATASDHPILDVGGYELNAAADVARIPIKVARSLMVATLQPQVVLSLSPHGGKIHVGNDADTAAMGLAQVAENVVVSRRPWYAPIVSLRVSVPIFVAAIAANIVAIWTDDPLLRASLLLLWLGGLLYYFAALRIRFTRYTVIRFERYAARRSFLERNRDPIAVGLIIAAVSALAGAIAGFLLGRP